MTRGVFWCNKCNAAIYGKDLVHCPHCDAAVTYLTTDARPVFACERRVLQFYGYDVEAATVWKSSKSRFYYINGESIALPVLEELQGDVNAIAAYIHQGNHYDDLDRRLIEDYQRQFQLGRPHRLELEYEAFEFIKHAICRFPNHEILVSFSGGKDSTVVSSLVRRALGRADVLHIFGDTTLEDDNTYKYIREFQEANPLVNFYPARAQHDFYELVEQIGPPSQVMRWCCTVFKTGPINDILQSCGYSKVLTFYGIRRSESARRSKYHKTSWNSPDRLGVVVKVDKDDESNAVTIGAKIGQQATASPIIDWADFDVWDYLLSHNLVFNKSYRLGFSRVGCLVCPMNSSWSEFLMQLHFPKETERWRTQLVKFARCIGKPDPEEYVHDRGWVKRAGGSGLPNRFTGLAIRPCGDIPNAVQIEIERPVNATLEEYLKPLGRINRGQSRLALGEIYLEGYPGQDWDALIVHAPPNGFLLRFVVINPRQDVKQLAWYFRKQATKFQTCIQCTACSAVCPHGAIVVNPRMHLYEVDQEICIGCLECVNHFGTRGCLVADALHATE